MSGIVGLYNLDGRPIDPAVLTRMTDVIAHRAPDGVRHWIDGPVGFGHCMFHTTPESMHEKQPFSDDTGNFRITFDGRLDNRQELRALLEAKGARFRTDTDTELVLKAYECWGKECPEWLIGDFSFAIWDKHSRRLFCARDRLGVKPFFYCFLPGNLFAFASEIKSLLSVPQVPRRLKEWLITELFDPSFEGFDKTATFYKDILKLEPAFVMSIYPDRTEARQYWFLDASREICLATDAEYVEEFRELFMEAVRCRMRAVGPVGVMLSGGIDSSSVVGTAAQVAVGMNMEVHTFSGVAERDCPETRFIDAVRQRIPIHSHRVRSDEAVQYAQDLERAILNATEPIEPTRNYVPRVLYRMAQREGIRVVLDGVDGDIATSQSYTIPYLLKAGRWQSAISQCREVATRRNWSTWSVLRFFGLRPFTPDSILWLWDKLRHNPTRQTDLFNKDYVNRIGLSKRIKLFEKQWQLRGHIRKDHAAFVTCGILPFSYEQYDLTAAAIPVEPRHPFSDHRLVEFCLGAPSEQIIRDGYTKSLLRRAADARLPDDVRWRVDKPSVAPQFVSAFLLSNRELFDEAFSQLDVIRNYVNVRQFQRIRRRYERKKDWGDRYLLLSAAYLVLWLRRTSFTV